MIRTTSPRQAVSALALALVLAATGAPAASGEPEAEPSARAALDEARKKAAEMGLELDLDAFEGVPEAPGFPIDLRRRFGAEAELRLFLLPEARYPADSDLSFGEFADGFAYQAFLQIGGWVFEEGGVAPKARLLARRSFPEEALRSDYLADRGEFLMLTGLESAYASGRSDAFVMFIRRDGRGLVVLVLLHDLGAGLPSRPCFAEAMGCLRFTE